LVIYLIISLIKPRHRMQVVRPIYPQALPKVEAHYFYYFYFLFFFSLSLYFNKFDLILKRKRKRKRVRCFLYSGTNLSSWWWKTPSPNPLIKGFAFPRPHIAIFRTKLIKFGTYNIIIKIGILKLSSRWSSDKSLGLRGLLSLWF